MILVDTSVWIDFFNGSDSDEVDLLVNAIQNDFVAVGDLILMELLQGFRSEKQAEEVRKELQRCTFYEIGGYDVAVQAAKNYRILRKKGITIRKSIDMMIGTFCIEQGLWLLHKDRDFTPMEELGLKVVK